MPSVGLSAGLCRASGYFRGLLYSQVSAPRDRRFLPTPSLAVTVAASGWLWVRLRLSRSALEPFLLRGAAGPGWGWETAPASWPGRWSRCLRPGAGLAGSLPPVVPPPPASAPPRRPASRRLSPCRTPPRPPRTRLLRVGARELPGTMRRPWPATRLAARAGRARVSERGSGLGLRARVGGSRASVRPGGSERAPGQPYNMGPGCWWFS